MTLDRRQSRNVDLLDGDGGITIQSIMTVFEQSGYEGAAQRFRDAAGSGLYVQAFNISPRSGLSDDEGSTKYAEHIAKWGSKVLPDPLRTTWCEFFVKTFGDCPHVLIASRLLSFILIIGSPEEGDRTNLTQYIDMISTFVALGIVSIVQTQTNDAQQKSFMKINNFENESNVIRNGEETQI
jgi:hypothetical protein